MRKASNIKIIKDKYSNIHNIYEQLMLNLSNLQLNLANEKSREYLMQGVGRRLKILNKCIHNIFKIFPVEKKDLLSQDDLTDLNINLHAFFFNISGIIDNLAWVFIYENNLYGDPKEGKIDKYGVGLFNKKTQKHLGSHLKEYLTSGSMQTWYNKYSKDYRGALAHRIPLHVPPSALTEEEKEEYMELERKLLDFSSSKAISQHNDALKKQSQLGRACPLFTHSFNEDSKPVFLHAQVIADFLTINELINKFCDSFKPKNL